MAGHMYNGRETELLIPASSLEVLKIAVIFGADAVYIGGEAFGLRAKAKNFSIEDMKEGVKFAHERNVKVYVTANILAHNYDLEGARAYFEELKEVGPDALIISDPGMFTIAKEVLPDIDIHISTQANNTNYMTYNFWWNQGAKRVVSARELSLEEIKEIREHIPDEMEIETFMHGAMCISYSGRCLLSSFLAGRDANRGACTHPCRWKYAVVEENRPGQYMPVYENERGTYIFNSKDLCMIEHIPEMVSSGIDSFKIEGRMKTALYVATVARTYRLAIDDFIEDPEKYKARIPFYKSEISKCTYRQYTTGFFFGKPDENTQIYDSNTYIREYTYLGIVGDVNEQGLYHIEQRNKFSVGETIEVMKPDGQNIEVTVKRIVDENLGRIMHNLILAILCSVAVSVLLKVARKKNIIIEQAIAFNYIVAISLSYFLLKPDFKGLEFTEYLAQSDSTPIFLALGILLPTVFIIMSKAVEFAGIVRSDAAQRLSLFLPIVASFIIFHETLSQPKIVGIILAFIGLFCILNKSNEQSAVTFKGILGLIGVWFGYGTIDILFKQVAKSGGAFPTTLFIAFSLAACVMFLYLFLKRTQWTVPSFIGGIILGVLNFFNILFYIKAHQSFGQNPTLVFAGMNIGVICLGTITGAFFFKEKISKINWFGVLISLSAIFCLYYLDKILA